jgi:hypothetical protein
MSPAIRSNPSAEGSNRGIPSPMAGLEPSPATPAQTGWQSCEESGCRSRKPMGGKAHRTRAGCRSETGLTPWADRHWIRMSIQKDHGGLLERAAISAAREEPTELNPYEEDHAMQHPRPIIPQPRNREILPAPSAIRAKNPPTTHAPATSCPMYTCRQVRWS